MITFARALSLGPDSIKLKARSPNAIAIIELITGLVMP